MLFYMQSNENTCEYSLQTLLTKSKLNYLLNKYQSQILEGVNSVHMFEKWL